MRQNTVYLLIIFILLVGGLLISVLFYDYHLSSLERTKAQTQTQTKDIVLGAIVYNVQQQGYVEIRDVRGDRLILIPYIP